MFNEDSSGNFDSENVSSNIKLSPTEGAFQQESAAVSVPGNTSRSSPASTVVILINPQPLLQQVIIS